MSISLSPPPPELDATPQGRKRWTRVQSQATMEVRSEDQPTNRPEPNLVVLRTEIEDIPVGGDVLLAVEVSDMTHADDFGRRRRFTHEPERRIRGA
jgi:hypothetical protein